MTSPLGQVRRSALVQLIVVAASAALFLVSLDAQWLKLDDFSMMAHFRSRGLGPLVADVFLTRTTPHVRFAFLEHLLFLPLFRTGFDHRACVNAVYLLVSFALLGAGWLLTRPFVPGWFTWLGAWGVYFAAMVTVPSWNTLEFKTASYLPLGFSLAVALWAYGVRLRDQAAPATPRQSTIWILLALATFHMAEATLFTVVPLAVSLAVRRRLRPSVVAATGLWPLVYWAANKLLAPRPLGLLGTQRHNVLALALTQWPRVTWRLLRPEVILLVTVAAWAVVEVARWAQREWKHLGGEFLEIVAFPAAGAALLLLVLMNSAGDGVPGYVSERHLLFVQLCLVAGTIIACSRGFGFASFRARIAVTALLVLVGATEVASRLPRFIAYVDARREELATTFALQRTVRERAAEVAHQSREMLVFITDWHLESAAGDELDPTFLTAEWSRQGFAHVESCPRDGACPPISYFPNMGWLRTRLTVAERANLCRRVPRADVLVLTDFRGLAASVPTAGWTEEQCLEWLDRAGVVTKQTDQ